MLEAAQAEEIRTYREKNVAASTHAQAVSALQKIHEEIQNMCSQVKYTLELRTKSTGDECNEDEDEYHR